MIWKKKSTRRVTISHGGWGQSVPICATKVRKLTQRREQLIWEFNDGRVAVSQIPTKEEEEVVDKDEGANEQDIELERLNGIESGTRKAGESDLAHSRSQKKRRKRMITKVSASMVRERLLRTGKKVQTRA